MYIPSKFAETRIPVLRALVRRHPLATLVAATASGVDAEHVPLLLDEARGPRGVLQGHVAKANPIWRRLSDGAEVLVVFQGPDHYVSPGWYPSKQQHGKVVPTWNYAVVHARGRLTWKHDPVWLRELLDRLTDVHEHARELPWQVTDAPADFVEHMLTSIVGLEIPVSSLEGKWKLSQNRGADDRAGVISGLEKERAAAASEMAGAMRAIETAGDRPKGARPGSTER